MHMRICLQCYLDRTNLAFASMQLTKDLNFTAETYGLGAGLFYLGALSSTTMDPRSIKDTKILIDACSGYPPL